MVEENTRPTCHTPVPPTQTRPAQKRVTHVSKISCLHYATPIQIPCKESGDPYIVSGRLEKPEATHGLVSMGLIQYCDCQIKEAYIWVKWHVAHARSTEGSTRSQVRLHPLLLLSSSTGLPQSMQTHTTHHTPELPLLQGASQVLQDYFTKDSQVIPDTGELLSIRRSVQLRTR